MQLKRLMIVLIIGVILLVVAGNGMYNSWQTFKEGSIWQSITSTKNEYVILDDYNQEVALEHKAKRIVAVGPNAADIVSEIAGDAVLVSTEPPLYASDSIKDRVDPNVEAIANLNPDVVFIESLDDNQRLIESLQKKGLKTVVLRHPTSVKGVREQLMKIGPFLGRDSKAQLTAKSLMNYVRDTESLRFSHRDEIANRLYNDPELANVKAIKNKRVEVISEQLILSKTYPIGLGMYNMAQIVYRR